MVGDALPAKYIRDTFTLTLKDLEPDRIGTYVSACKFVEMSAFAVLRKYFQYFYCLERSARSSHVDHDLGFKN